MCCCNILLPPVNNHLTAVCVCMCVDKIFAHKHTHICKTILQGYRAWSLFYPLVSLAVIHRDLKQAAQINNKLSLWPDPEFMGWRQSTAEHGKRCFLWASEHWEHCHYFEVDRAQRLVPVQRAAPTATCSTALWVVTGRFLLWLITVR